MYLDIRYALPQMISYTLTQSGFDTSRSALLQYLNTVFYFGELAREATVNIPDRIKIYSNPNYDDTFRDISQIGKQLL